jgi:hypothetical protein
LASDPKIAEPTEDVGQLVREGRSILYQVIHNAYGVVGQFSASTQQFAPGNSQTIHGDAVGVAGPGASVGSISATQYKGSSDLGNLIFELKKVAEELRRTAISPEEKAGAELVNAAAGTLETAGEGGRSTALVILKGAGRVVAETAERIGTKLVGEMLERALSLPPRP